MGVYVFNTGTLIHALSDDAKRNTSHDFGKNIIPDLVSSNRVCVYNFTERGTRLGSYWRDVGTVDAYYRANMELLLNPSFDPYDDADWPLYSFEGGRPYYTDTDRGAVGPVRDSVISREVSLARGSHVLHSVLSPGVQIGRFAKVHNSILLHDVHVGVGARIQRAILDENVRIADGVAIGYDVERDREYGLVTDSGIVVIPANTHVGPSQTLSPPRANWRTELVKNDRTKSQQRDEISRTTQFDKE
jgi:glucose-1-phosphate adenylyltransferase